jgi:hypothetical protein
MTSADISTARTNGGSTDERDWNAIEPQRSALRVLVAKIDVELGAMQDLEPLSRSEALGRLRGTWAKLVAELALGAEPSLRMCPFCRLSIRQGATRCRYCLKQSPAGAATSASPPNASGTEL